MNRGDVVLAFYPFASGSGGKRRPVLSFKTMPTTRGWRPRFWPRSRQTLHELASPGTPLPLSRRSVRPRLASEPWPARDTVRMDLPRDTPHQPQPRRGVVHPASTRPIRAGNAGRGRTRLAAQSFSAERYAPRRKAVETLPRGQVPSPPAAGLVDGTMSATATRPTSLPSIATGTDCPTL